MTRIQTGKRAIIFRFHQIEFQGSKSMTKTAVITGAGSGIGQAIAVRLAEDDCNIVIFETHEDAAQSTA